MRRFLRRWLGLQTLEDKSVTVIDALANIGYDEGYTRKARVKHLRGLADYANALADSVRHDPPEPASRPRED